MQIELPEELIKEMKKELWYVEEDEGKALKILLLSPQEVVDYFIERNRVWVNHIDPERVEEHFEECLDFAKNS